MVISLELPQKPIQRLEFPAVVLDESGVWEESRHGGHDGMQKASFGFESFLEQSRPLLLEVFFPRSRMRDVDSRRRCCDSRDT